MSYSKKSSVYFVYIATNRSATLYTGVTNNIERRMLEHKLKTADGFTTRYQINKLIYFQEFNDVEDAIYAEKRIKGWTRKKKMELIKSINQEFKDLLNESQTS